MFDNKVMLEHACTKFQEQKYDEALEIFVLLYMKGYEREWILEAVYNCYMSGNHKEFQEAFQRYEEEYGILYDDCILDFIPYQDSKYYIFDKELAIFRGIFSISDLKDAGVDPVCDNMEFSAIALELDWNWKEEISVLTEAAKRKIYVVCHDLKRCVSFFKIPELAEYMQNVKLFSDIQEFQQYFHKNVSIYLPKCWNGRELADKIAQIVNQEHQYRLTPEGRSTDNVLLTIGIPTANRGHLVLKRLENLLKMPFDAEIEIAISKNCMDYYQEEYDKIPQMPDARIHYFDHGKALKATDNWIYTVEMAHGKYVLIVSDEDDVVLTALEHYLALLTNHPELSLLRTRTCFQCAGIVKREYGKKGIDAFSKIFLSQNYLSGLIVRRQDFVQEDFRMLHRFVDNAFYTCYPHEWWCAALSRKGDFLEEPVTLISENESMVEEETRKLREQGKLEEGKVGLVKDSKLPAYSTYKARLEQFWGCIGFIHFFMEGNREGIELALGLAIAKTAYLFELAFSYQYELASFPDMVDQLVHDCMKAIDEFELKEEQKLHLLDQTGRQAVRLIQLYDQINLKEASV